MPFVAAVHLFVHNLYELPMTVVLWHTAKVAAACAVAGSAVLLFLAALAFVRPTTAAGLSLAYGLGTCVWSTSSQALWQHGPTEFFLALGTFFLMRESRARSAPWIGLSYTLAFACRPTAALALAAAAVYYAVRDRRALFGFVLGCVPVTALLLAYNLHYFGKVVALGQMADAARSLLSAGVGIAYAASPTTATNQLFGTSLTEGLLGSLVSPSRGLLVFSPAIGFAFWGLVRVWRDSRFSALRPVSLAALAMCFVGARWYGWWGGWCYGYRLLVDAVTLIAFLAIPVAEEIRRRRLLLTVLGACSIWGITVQVLGAFAYDVVGWNNRTFIEVQVEGGKPQLFTDPEQVRKEAWAHRGARRSIEVDVNNPTGHHRLWTIRDSQILYYLESFSDARAIKQAAIEQFLHNNG